MPGVHAIITAADFHAGARYLHEGASDRPPLADGLVRFIGQEVAAVAAETRAQALAALRLIEIEYQILLAPLNIEAALASGAARLHDRPTGETDFSSSYSGIGDRPRRAVVPGHLIVAGEFFFPPGSCVHGTPYRYCQMGRSETAAALLDLDAGALLCRQRSSAHARPQN